MQRFACFWAIVLGGFAPAFASAPPAGALSLPDPPRVSVDYAHWNELVHQALDGDASSASVIGRIYAYGIDAPHDVPEAMRWLNRGVDLGSTEAKRELGLLLLRGDNSQNDSGRAASLLLQAAHAGDAEATSGMMYPNGEGVPQDWHLAVDCSRNAADQDNPWAQANPGLFSEAGPEGPSRAVAGNHSVINAQLRLGDIAHLGELGQTRSDQVALSWYRLAAGQGDALAEQKIGDLFWQGSADLPRDRAEAVRHYSIAANKGFVPAARQLAIAYANGDGAAPDDLKMLHWQRVAAEGGDPVAAGMLGYAIMIGLDGTYDFIEAATWLTLAAEKARPSEWRAHAAFYSQVAQSKLTSPEQEAFRARLARRRAVLGGP